MRRSALPAVLASSLLVAAARPGVACDNDRDAIPMERNRVPDVVAVLSGAYVRHSEAWYAWRAQEAGRALLAASGDGGVLPSERHLALLDDLGVAYDKLGRRDDAIAVGREALARSPDRYESLANLGTYLAHAGRVEEGLPLLRRAVEVNPSAHFGRARFEIAFFEYVEERRRPDGSVALPLSAPAPADGLRESFPAHLAARRTPPGATIVPLSSDELTAAAAGVVGMMFSTRHDDPLLLEALAHTLVVPEQPWRATVVARPLAARAYLAAAASVGDPVVAAAYRAAASDALVAEAADGGDRVVVELVEVEEWLAEERAKGEALTERMRADERAWIASAEDPEAAFAAKYLAPERVALPRRGWPGGTNADRPGPLAAFVYDDVGRLRGRTSDRVPTKWLLVAVLGLLVGAFVARAASRGPRRSSRRALHRSGLRPRRLIA